MIEEYIAKKVLDAAVRRVADTFKDSSDRDLPPVDLEAALSHHLKQVKSWCSTVSFADLHRPKSTSRIFVELSLYVFPRRLRLDIKERVPTLPLRQAIEEATEASHVILLGQPGAGKTTAMKYLCQKVLMDSDFLSDRVSFPLVLRLRDLNTTSRSRKAGPGLIFEAIQDILGIPLPKSKDLKGGATPASVLEQLVAGTLEELGTMIVLDGFDELATDKARESVIADIRKLASILDKSVLIITSRCGEFNYSIDGCRTLELSPLSFEQVADFAQRWLDDEQKTLHFLREVEKSPFSDTQIRPLNLAHLLAIYDRVERIPEKPKTVYRKIVQLLLEEWDEQRSVIRRSRYSGFEVDRKLEFLSALAFALTSRQNQSVFSEGDLLRAYHAIGEDFQLPLSDGLTVVAEIEGHTGLLIRAGHDLFEFSHKSIQEYLAAEHIVKLPSIPDSERLLTRIPNELAIAIAISSRPSQYFCELIFHRLLPLRLNHEFLTTFVNRILLEKVDFERNLDASMAFIALYSKYMDVTLKQAIQLSLFVREELLPEFERLAGILIKTPLRKGLLKDYQQAERIDSLDGSKLAVLRKNTRHKPHKWRYQDNMPSVLYLREGLVSGD